MANRHSIAEADIMPMAEYARVREATRRRIAARKRNRRVEVGPFVTFYFENYETMWLQVHEMLHAEKGGAQQIPDELAAYNPLIPQGSELVATFMIEIEEERRRRENLARLGGIEHAAFMSLAGETINGQAEADSERTTPEGKTSSVHFAHFRFTQGQIAEFRKPGAQVVLGLAHENYRHMAILSEAVREELAGDFD